MSWTQMKCPCGCTEVQKTFRQFGIDGQTLQGDWWMKCGHYVNRQWDQENDKVITTITGYKKVLETSSGDPKIQIDMGRFKNKASMPWYRKAERKPWAYV